MEFWHSHALISDTTRDGLMNKCNFSRIGPLRVEAVTKGSAKVRTEMDHK